MRKRCQSFTLKNRKCKNNFKFVCHSKKFCLIHAEIYAKNYVIIIQKIYRAYHSRKYLQTFKLMPRDIQCRILFYMREEHYMNTYNKSLQKILNKRVDNLIGTPWSANYGNTISFYMNEYRTKILEMNVMTQFREHILKLNKLFTLYSEYITITSDTYNTFLYNRSYNIKQYTEERLYASNYVVHPDTFTLEDLTEINTIMSQMKHSIETYKKAFKRHYNLLY